MLFFLEMTTAPIDPLTFCGELAFRYSEDDNGHIPKSYEGVISCIAVESEVSNDKLVTFHGKVSPYRSKCFDIQLNNHNYGLYFEVACNNSHETFKDKILWRRAIDSKTLHELLQSKTAVQINLLGDAPEVPNCPASMLTLILRKDKNHIYVTSVSLEMSCSTYALFIKRYA